MDIGGVIRFQKVLPECRLSRKEYGPQMNRMNADEHRIEFREG